MRNSVYAAFFLCFSVFSASAQSNEPAPLPVGTIVASRKAVEKTMDFRGRIDAIQRVDIRARVTGYLEDVLFHGRQHGRRRRAALSDRRRPV